MNITNLKAAPHLLETTLELIGKAFKYQSPHHFQTDFAPLISEDNLKNCFIIVDESEKVLAHIGVSVRRINNFPVAMLGGIAVDESRRGEGIFQTLMQGVLSEKRSEVAFFLLWSDLEKLYNKFGFHLCGTQLEVDATKKESSLEKAHYHLLTESEKKQIQHLYQTSFQDLYSTVERSDSDWDKISHIKSADLYLKKDQSKITDYFFMNKGQDLSGIIYEYGSSTDIKTWLNIASGYGKVWMGKELAESQEMHYQFFLTPGDTKLFGEFIHKHTNGLITIRDINPMKQEVYFYFNEELLALDMEEFLRGTLGPGTFEELGKTRPLFISGLDSI